MFVTALAPNALAVSLVSTTLGITISWMDWFKGFAPVGFILLALVPYLLYKVYPPEITRAPEAPRWAADELARMGPISRSEMILLVLVTFALALWIGAGDVIDPAMAAVLTVFLMVIFGVVSWSEVVGNAQAWNVLIWFATLVTLASGLTETKFVEWLGQTVAPRMSGFTPTMSIVALVGVFFFLHYLFASITAHAATLLPVFLGVAAALPTLAPTTWALLLGYSLGLMGILTPYGGAHLAIYYGSGYIKGRRFLVAWAVARGPVSSSFSWSSAFRGSSSWGCRAGNVTDPADPADTPANPPPTAHAVARNPGGRIRSQRDETLVARYHLSREPDPPRGGGLCAGRADGWLDRHRHVVRRRGAARRGGLRPRRTRRAGRGPR